MDADPPSSATPHAFATGSAVVNMIRQIGLAVGVAAFVALLGDPLSQASRLLAFDRGWWFTALVAFAGVVPALVVVGARRPILRTDP